jgi:hypothetical protein
VIRIAIEETAERHIDHVAEDQERAALVLPTAQELRFLT